MLKGYSHVEGYRRQLERAPTDQIRDNMRIKKTM